MSIQITEAFVQMFTSGITHNAEQKNARMRNAVRNETIVPGDRAFFDFIGAVTAVPVTTRHADTVYTDTPHSRRMVVPVPYKHADLIDKDDKVRTLNDPTNNYVIAFARAFNRAIDDVIIAAATGTAATGVAGAGSETWASLSGTYEHGTGTAMTLGKIITSNKLLRAAENDPDDGFFQAASQVQFANMLADTTFTSADYNSIRTLMTGTISQFMGFEWIPSERLSTTSGERDCIAWARNSLLLGLAANPEGKIDVLPTKNYSTQVFYAMDIGAVRMDGTGVVNMLCTE